MIKTAKIRVAYHIYAIVTFIIFLAIGCSHNQSDSNLIKVASCVEKSPSKAIAILDSIDYHSLSEPDRHLYDLYSIKARDKAYIQHTSDSLILNVIKYYSSKDNNSLYCEALYYGGRVYCDLGDYPTALKFFHQVLDTIPDDHLHLPMKASIVSQYGGLLRDLRLYQDAIPYIRQSLELDRLLGDTISEVYDLQLLGDTYMAVHNYGAADSCFHQAIDNSSNLSPSFLAKSSMYLAALKYKIGDYDSAHYYIYDTPDRVNPVSRNEALAYAARIYLKQGLVDTAFLYAKALIESPDMSNKQSGYHVILSPEIRRSIHPDSVDCYISEYRTLLETLYDENENKLSLNQQGTYNYTIHERERRKVEASNLRLTVYLESLIIIILLLTVLIINLRNRNYKNKVRLKAALYDITKLRQSLTFNEIANTNENEETCEGKKNYDISSKNSSTKVFREKLRLELIELYKQSSVDWIVPDEILKSEAYGKLQAYIAEKHIISDTDELWNKIEEIVLSCSPHLKKNLTLLTSGNLKIADYRTALLIKCGLRPNEMAILLGRSKGAISSRRENLCIKILGDQMGSKAFDSIIRCM